MRDPQRIPDVIAALTELWTRYPDLRLGQLMCCMRRGPEDDVFYVEDDEMLRRLRRDLAS